MPKRNFMARARTALVCWTVVCAQVPAAWGARLAPGSGAREAAAVESRGAVADAQELEKGYGALPMSFEPNVGQCDERVAFVARGRGYTVFVTPEETVLSVGGQTEGARPAPAPSEREEPAPSALRMRCAGASAAARVVALEPFEGTSNYFLGNDPSRWHTEVPNYGRVRLEGVYDGVDLDFYGTQRQLEYDFRVAPGADASQVRVWFDGAEAIDVDESGDLVLRMRGGEIRQQRARVYQDGPGGRREVSARYAVTGYGEVGFDLGAYDPGEPLVIDPVLVYSTYVGGSDGEECKGIAVDAAGAAYIAGDTSSTDFPTAGPFQGANAGTWDVFVAKLNPAGTALVYATYLGGVISDKCTGIGVDGAGAAYVTGYTVSDNFPTVNPLQAERAGREDAFVTKLNPAGTALVYSTYLGGSSPDFGNGIAVDASGVACVTGGTDSLDFPTVNAIQSGRAPGRDAFVTKLGATGTSLYYSTYFGGSGGEAGFGVAFDTAGAAYVVGDTGSTNLFTANAFQAVSGGGDDAFVMKLTAVGGLAYATYLGGSGNDKGLSIAVDIGDNACITGVTSSTDFPTVNPFQAANAGGQDAFVTRLTTAGTAAVYSTYLGGSGTDTGWAVAVDSNLAAYVVGSTGSTDFPTLYEVQAANAGGGDALVTKLNASGALVYSTYLGGSASDFCDGVAVDNGGAAYIAGVSFSADFPTMYPEQSANAGSGDAVVAKLTPCADTLQFSASSYSVTEGGTATITVTRTGCTGGDVTVFYTTSDDTAVAGTDYTATHGVFTFPAGVTTPMTFSVRTAEDASAQGNRVVNLSLSSPSGGAVLGQVRRAPLTIVDDDPAGTLEFSVAAFSVNENTTSHAATVTVNRIQGSTGTVTVDFRTGDNTATAGSDYTTTSGTLTFADGVTSQSFTVPISDDILHEGNESLHLTLSNPTHGAVLGHRSHALLTIVDDDTSGSFAFSATSYSVGEGNAAAIVITRGTWATAEDVTFATSANGTAQPGVDYTSVTQTVHFGIGETQQTVTVPTTDDATAEGVESVNLTLSNQTQGATLGARRTAVLVIDDAPGILQFSAAVFTVAEGAASHAATITVTRTDASAGTIAVKVLTSSNTATAGTDYTTTNRGLTFADGVTSVSFTVPIIDDVQIEGNECLNLTLASPTGGAALGNARCAVLIITDND